MTGRRPRRWRVRRVPGSPDSACRQIASSSQASAISRIGSSRRFSTKSWRKCWGASEACHAPQRSFESMRVQRDAKPRETDNRENENREVGMARKTHHGNYLRLALMLATMTAVPAYAFQSEGTVRIGSLEAQTGVPAPYGIQALIGSQIAIDEINQAGGIKVDGKMVKLQLTPGPNGYDPSGDSATTIALLKKLVSDDQVLVIKGTSRSDNTEAAFNYLNELDKQGSAAVLMSAASATPGLGKITKWGFRNAFFEGQLIQREMQMLHDKLGYK